MTRAGIVLPIALALLALAAGAACYPLFRGAGASIGLPLTGQLPAFLHSFGFGLLFLLVLQPWPRWHVPVMILWALVLCAAEGLQFPAPPQAPAARTVQATPATERTPARMSDSRAPAPVASHPAALLRAHRAGTFDPADLAASALGALTALAALAMLRRRHASAA